MTKRVIFFLLLIISYFCVGVIQASEYEKSPSLEKKIELLEKEVLNLKMKIIVEDKFEWQILKLSEIENDIKRLHNRFEILENNYHKELEKLKNLTNDVNKRISFLEGEEIKEIEKKKDILDQNKKSAYTIEESIMTEEEKIYFNALNLYDAGDLKNSEMMFLDFVEQYPNSALLSNVFFWRAEIKASQENWMAAANDYLESFSISPNGKYSPKTLFGLGVSLGAIGEKEQACLTLDEVQVRFPEVGVGLKQNIDKAKKLLNCG